MKQNSMQVESKKAVRQFCLDGIWYAVLSDGSSRPATREERVSLLKMPQFEGAKSASKPGPFPLRVELQANKHYAIITNQGNLWAMTADPTAARLIAAAPDLLEACKLVSSNWSYGSKGSPLEKILNTVRDAISKAEGR